MARQPRSAPGGLVYHVLNRSAGRTPLFRRDKDFLAFRNLLCEAQRRCPIELFAYCVMGNHWHLVLRPQDDGDLSAFMRWLTLTHAVRWRVSHHSVGDGPLYQGRFKSFPIQEDRHFLIGCRYVERNALTAGLVRRSQDWPWCSLWQRQAADIEGLALPALSPWPVPMPRDWPQRVNEPIGRKELERLRLSTRRGRPLGDDRWTDKMVATLGLLHTVRSEGRPGKASDGSRKN
jgi:putative transposase